VAKIRDISINAAPVIESVDAEPDSIKNDGSEPSLISARVSDLNGLDDIQSVTINLSSLGGSASQLVYDDGSHGDKFACDGIYSYRLSVNNASIIGFYFPVIAVRDNVSATDSKEVKILVTKKVSFSTDHFWWDIVVSPGASGRRTLSQQIDDMLNNPQTQGLGVKYAKFWMGWEVIEPNAEPIDDFSHDVFWKNFENYVNDYANATGQFAGLIDCWYYNSVIEQLNQAGIRPVPLICDGLATPRKNGYHIAPDPEGITYDDFTGVGHDEYLKRAVLHAAAVARRYSSGDFKVVLWNTENELNWTWTHELAAWWRKNQSGMWSNKAFLTKLIKTLYEGVHYGNPDAFTTMNINVNAVDYWYPILLKVFG
jgi:hypothetical protein